MKVLMVSKALVVGTYQRKIEEMARCSDVELVAVVPPSWRDRSHELPLEPLHQTGYRLVVSPIAVNGSFHLFFFPELGQLLDEHQPDLLHLDEEPYNLATFLGAWGASRRCIPFVFFTWQNLVRRYPPPFSWMERYVYGKSAWAIAGTSSAGDVLRTKGYRGGISVIPQFGVDPVLFATTTGTHSRGSSAVGSPFTIGFAGRLVAEKGVSLLVEACANLPVDFRLVFLGAGPAISEIQERARAYGIEDRVSVESPIRSADMPRWLHALDVLVLPSVSHPNWTEQFGRVLVEAMAAGVPVVGSSSGEIPSVIGDTGLIFPEGDAAALAAALARLASDTDLRADLAARGRQRVADQFTHERIAVATVEVYRHILGGAGAPGTS